MVLEQGLIEGRKTYANMMKYIKMTVSSNFGNMLSVLAASAFLPFLPMTALQLILLNLVYDLSCTRHFLGQRGRGIPAQALPLGCRRRGPLHGLERPGQFAV